MALFHPKFLEVQVPWVMRHDWPRRQRYLGLPNPMHTLWLVTEGHVEVRIGEREYSVAAGMAFLSPPGQKRTITTPHGARWISICFGAALLGQMDVLELMDPPIAWQPEEPFREPFCQTVEALADEWAHVMSFSPPALSPGKFDNYITEYYSTGATPDPVSLLLCDSYARTVVGMCLRMLNKTELAQAAQSNLPPWLLDALHEMRADPDISIEQLARDSGISPTQLRRHFQKWFNASPREYINRLRLEDARQLLMATDLPVNEIAERIGFFSPPHFSRVFKKAYNMPPARYRDMSRSGSTKIGSV